MFSYDVNKVPPWLLSIAAIAAVIVVVVQLIRGDAIVCDDGSIFA